PSAQAAAAAVPTPTPIPPTSTPQPAAAAAAASPAAPQRAPTAVPSPAGGAEVTAKINQDAWLQVEVDGQRSFEGVLKAGQSQTWKGKEQVFVWVGNAGGLSIVFNGKDLGPLGAVGEVVKKEFKRG